MINNLKCANLVKSSEKNGGIRTWMQIHVGLVFFIVRLVPYQLGYWATDCDSDPQGSYFVLGV